MAFAATNLGQRALAFGLVTVLTAVASCSGDANEQPAHSTRQPIFYGTSDTARDAVMALLHAPNLETVAGSCSGTVIHAAQGFGHMLTAAHCVGERDEDGELLIPFSPIPPGDLVVVPGFDWFLSELGYTVQDYVVHPSYQGEPGSLHDVAVARFFYGGESTPATMPIMTADADDLSEGDSFTLVGFGRTESNDLNTERNQVDRDIYQLTNYSVVHLQNGGGTCMGDSGGPGVVVVGSEEVVAVVSSAIGGTEGQDPCETGAGLGVRVSAYEDFIQDYVDLASVDPGCDACLVEVADGACQSESENCLTATPCGDYLGCTELCQTADCQRDCAAQHQEGYVDYLELYLCSCGACDACAAEPLCEQLECGYSNVADWCECEREGCCIEALECTRDATCLACSTVSGFDLGCTDNASLVDLGACIAGCADECSASSSGTGGGIDVIDWPDPEMDDPIDDAGTEPDAEAPDAGAEQEPDSGGGDQGGGEAGSSGSDDEDDAAALASDSGCGCRLGGRPAVHPLPFFLLAGVLVARRGRSARRI